MKFFLDFFPLVGFFAAFKLYDFMMATIVLIILTIIQVVGTWIMTKKIEKIHIITLVAVTFFGGLTLFFDNEDFLKWKLSIVMWLFGGTIAVRTLMKKPSIEKLLGQALDDSSKVDTKLWTHLEWTWVSYFILIGFVNLVVAFQMSTDTWVSFKVWGIIVTQLIVIIYSVYKLFPYLEQEENSPTSESESTSKEENS